MQSALCCIAWPVQLSGGDMPLFDVLSPRKLQGVSKKLLTNFVWCLLTGRPVSRTMTHWVDKSDTTCPGAALEVGAALVSWESRSIKITTFRFSSLFLATVPVCP